MRTRTLSLLLAALVAATGCAGPRDRIAVQMKELPGDVALGHSSTTGVPTTSPTAVNPEPIGFPPFLQPAPAVTFTETGDVAGPAPTLPPPPQPVGCGTAGPSEVPRREAPKNVTAPPASATLGFRNTGTWEITTRAGLTRQGVYPTLSTRTVHPKPNPDGTFGYVVVEVVGATRTATQYLVDRDRGLFLQRVTTTYPDGSSDDFQATPGDGLKLLPFPVVAAAQIGGAAVDPRTATSMSLVGNVVGKARVDACGTPLDAWEVQITDGRITGPNKQQRFTASYHIGTQYGALSLREVVEFSCDEQVNEYCDNGRRYRSKNTAVIAVEPPAAT